MLPAMMIKLINSYFVFFLFSMTTILQLGVYNNITSNHAVTTATYHSLIISSKLKLQQVQTTVIAFLSIYSHI